MTQQETKQLSTVEVLSKLNGGGTIEEIRDGIESLTDAVISTGKSGSITLTLKFAKTGSNALVVADDVKVKMPIPDKDKTVFYRTRNGGLSRSDENQGVLGGIQ